MSGPKGKLFFSASQLFKRTVGKYKKSLEKHPILIQSIQTGILYGCSDVLAQTAVEKTNVTDVNVKRTIVFFTTGAIYTGPAQSLWFRFLARKMGSTGRWVPLKKVLVDQLVFAPIFHVCLLTIVNTLHGRNIAFIREQLRLKYVDVVTTSLKLWPMVQLVNFTYVPLNYQVLVGQTVALFWNVYMSWKTQCGIITGSQEKVKF